MSFDIGSVGAAISNKINEIRQNDLVQDIANRVTSLFSNNGAATVTQADTALHNVAAQVQTGGGITPEQQAEIDKSIEQIFQQANYGDAAAAVELANQLQGKSDEYQAELIKQFVEKSNGYAFNVIRAAGGERNFVSEPFLTDVQRYIIGSSLGDAYKQGKLSSNFVDALLQHDSKFSMPPNNEYSANIIALSGSKDLINAFIDKSLELAKGNEPEYIQSFVLGAARAMASDPQILQERMAKMSDEEFTQFLKDIDPERFSNAVAGYDYGYTNALATLVNGAARIQPPTPEVLRLFQTAAGNYMDRSGMNEAMSKLFTAGYTTTEHFGRISEDVFHSNAEYFMMNMTKLGRGPEDMANLNAMTKFFQHTLFSDNPYMAGLKDEVRSTAENVIRIMQSAIKNYPNVDDRTKQIIDSTFPHPDNIEETKQLMAARLGFFADAIFEGYEDAVKAGEDREAAAKEVVNLLFEMVPFGDGLKKLATKLNIPELIASKTEDAAKDALTNWLAGKNIDDEQDRATVWNAFVAFAANLGDENEIYANEVYDGAGRADLIDGANR